MSKPPAPGMNAKGVGGIKKKYLVIGGAGALLVGVMYYRRQTTTSSTPAVDTTSPTDTSTITDPYAGYGTGYGTGAGGAYGPVAPDTSVDSAAIAAQAAETAAQSEADTATALSALAGAFSAPVLTNHDWQSTAIHTLEAHGYTPAQARHAVANYLAGTPLSAVQAHTIETAVGVIGPPPTSPPPISIINPHNGNAGTQKTRGQKPSKSGQSSKTSNKGLAAQPPPTKPTLSLGWIHIPLPAPKKPAKATAPAKSTPAKAAPKPTAVRQTVAAIQKRR